MVRAQAVRLIPRAAIGMAPHTTTLVNIDTIMWVAARAQTLPVVTILGRKVSIAITVAHVDWSFGDGAGNSSGPAGKAYDEAHHPCRTRHCTGYFAHEYRHTGTVQVTATASYTATFRVDGGAPIDIPGTVPGPQAASALVVKQARGVLVPDH
jgi:hypothetical protein